MPEGQQPAAAGLTVEDAKQASTAAQRYLLERYSPGGNWVGWLMIWSIFIESFDFYSISFVLIYVSKAFHPSTSELSLAAAGVQGGAVVGSLVGGWLTDRLGRRLLFTASMIIFIVFGLAQAFVPNIWWLIVVRTLLGIPLGADVSTGYSFLMEALPPKKREVMGNRWQFMFALGEVVTIGIVTALVASGIGHNLLWRMVLGLSAVPAAAVLVLRSRLPESAMWLVSKGRFSEAKATSMASYGDSLDMLPDVDTALPAARIRDFFPAIRRDSFTWRASLFAWISCATQSIEFSTFAFFIPLFLVLLNISSAVQTNLLTLGLYVVAMISGAVGPWITPRIGLKKLSSYGYSLSFIGLMVAGTGLVENVKWLVPVGAIVFLWGHYFDAEPVMTISSMVAPPEFRGTASGVAYMFVKLPSFASIYAFPQLFDAIGKGYSTLLIGVFPVIGLLASIFVLPEVFGSRADVGSDPEQTLLAGTPN